MRSGFYNYLGKLTAIPGLDPYWADVKSLMQLSTDTSDAKGLVWAATGASVSSGSLLIENVGDTVETPFNTSFNWFSQPTVLECFINTSVYGPDSTGRPTLIGLGVYAPGNIWFWFGPETGGLLRFGYWAGFARNITATTNNIPIGNWIHVAMQFDGTDIRLYAGGVMVASAAYGTAPAVSPSGSPPLRIGWRDGTLGVRWRGRVRGFRLTHGVRYTGDFTPPALPLPES